MIKKKAFTRIFVVTFVLILFLCFCYIKKDKPIIKENNYSSNYSNVYLLTNDYVVKTTMYINEKNLEEKIKKYISSIIKENSENILLPDNFEPIIPAGTKLLDLKIDNDIIKIYFSKEFENATEKQYEKILECLTYTIMQEENILGIEIYAQDNMIKYIPQTSKLIPTLLDLNYGINKTYEITSNKNINKIVEFYYMLVGDKYLMLPVTIYKNDNREKVEIVVDDLSGFIYYNDLISYVDSNLKLIKYELGDEIKLYFNRELKDEEMNQIIYSVFANYNSNKISIYYNENKILEKNKKDIEK